MVNISSICPLSVELTTKVAQINILSARLEEEQPQIPEQPDGCRSHKTPQAIDFLRCAWKLPAAADMQKNATHGGRWVGAARAAPQETMLVKNFDDWEKRTVSRRYQK
jgi:hypothetical protein